MDRKRRNTSSPESDTPPPPKRSRQVSENFSDSDDDDDHPIREQPRIDNIYGQKGAFPGLGGEDDNELFYGPASDGIEYLRMVRSEAKTVPRLLVAPEINSYKPVDSESGGFFDDDAYIAASLTKAPTQMPDEADAQDEYYQSLLLRFEVVRSTLRCTPPVEVISRLPSSRPITYPRDSKKARITWRKILLTSEPLMVQLACMDMRSILGVVSQLTDILPRVVQSRDTTQINHVGAWIWGCLGRCNDVGQLSSEEVAELRELGKSAVASLVSVRDGIDVSKVHKTVSEAGSESGEETENLGSKPPDPAPNPTIDQSELGSLTAPGDATESSELQQAKERLATSLNAVPDVGNEGGDDMEMAAKAQEAESASNLDTCLRALLDMVLTVVGEKYGQRDLLEFRDIWEENAEN